MTLSNHEKRFISCPLIKLESHCYGIVYKTLVDRLQSHHHVCSDENSFLPSGNNPWLLGGSGMNCPATVGHPVFSLERDVGKLYHMLGI